MTEEYEIKEIVPIYEYSISKKEITQKVISERTTTTGQKVNIIEAEGKIDYQLLLAVKKELTNKITAFQEHLNNVNALINVLPKEIKGE